MFLPWGWLEEQVKVDMRVVCPLDVAKMLLKQARTVYCKRWAAKHECEELHGVRLEPNQAILRRKPTDAWTDKHRSVMRKLVVGAGWVQKRLYDIRWSGERKCRGCNQGEGTAKRRLYHCPSWREVRNQKG